MLSDTHIPADQDEQYRGFRPVANLKKVVPRLLEHAPDGALISGDIARLVGAREDYDVVKALLEPLASRWETTTTARTFSRSSPAKEAAKPCFQAVVRNRFLRINETSFCLLMEVRRENPG